MKRAKKRPATGWNDEQRRILAAFMAGRPYEQLDLFSHESITPEISESKRERPRLRLVRGGLA